MNTYGKIGLFLGGVLLGSAGFKLLGSKDAKRVYTHATAAYLRCKDEVMEQVETMQDNCADILADAKAINAERTAQAQETVIQDTSADQHE